MALLHQTRKNGVLYEVRTAGASRRLYTNRAFHTQYHPKHLFTGAIWDCLSLPSLCLNEPPKRVLVLGVAGGTVIHQLQQLHAPTSVIGIELDAMHISLAKKYFSLNYDNLQIIHADAKAWLAGSRATFDYIVDDVFLHAEDGGQGDGEADPARSVELDINWFDLLKKHLSPDGVLIQNHIDEAQAQFACKQLANTRLIQFETQGFENQVLAAFPRNKSADHYKSQLKKRLANLNASERRRLRHTTREVN
ncbi:MAG: spermidine synthase [Candidatus Azotimanducaceae bacterium]